MCVELCYSVVRRRRVGVCITFWWQRRRGSDRDHRVHRAAPRRRPPPHRTLVVLFNYATPPDATPVAEEEGRVMPPRHHEHGHSHCGEDNDSILEVCRRGRVEGLTAERASVGKVGENVGRDLLLQRDHFDEEPTRVPSACSHSCWIPNSARERTRLVHHDHPQPLRRIAESLNR